MAQEQSDKSGVILPRPGEVAGEVRLQDGDIVDEQGRKLTVYPAQVVSLINEVNCYRSARSHVARKPDERDHAILKAVLTERAQAIALAHRLTTTEGYGACTTGGIRILCEALLRVDEALLAVPSLSETFAASTIAPLALPVRYGIRWSKEVKWFFDANDREIPADKIVAALNGVAVSATACSEEPMAWAVVMPKGHEFDYIVFPEKQAALDEIGFKELEDDALVPLFRRPDGSAQT